MLPGIVVTETEKIRICLRPGTSGLVISSLIDNFGLVIEGPYTVYQEKSIEIFCRVPRAFCDVLMVDIAGRDFVESVEVVPETSANDIENRKSELN